MDTPHKIIIEAGKANTQYWRDVWSFRNLFSLLAWRDITVRYKQTVIGFAWAIVRPLFTIVAFSFLRFLFGGTDSEGSIPYPLMIAAGTLAWALFSTIVNEIANSLVGNANLINKVYFPRIVIPLATTVVCLIDFLISLVIIVAMMIYYQYVPSFHIFALPLFILLLVVSAIGFGLYFAAVSVKYRDFRYILPFALQIGMYVCPVVYSTASLQEKLANYPSWIFTLYKFNPLVNIIDGFRWCMFGDVQLEILPLITSIAVSVLFLILGVFYFRKLENEFADVI
ncbi:MAG: ABC transporter permease [Bacteroidetes bacterium]|nr:ABC transporter permease [Bacteroidota bacterium]